MGVVVRRHIDILIIIITFPTPIYYIALFWQQHPYFFVHLKIIFFRSCINELHHF